MPAHLFRRLGLRVADLAGQLFKGGHGLDPLERGRVPGQPGPVDAFALQDFRPGVQRDLIEARGLLPEGLAVEPCLDPEP